MVDLTSPSTPHLPITMTAWAKVHVVGGGSKIRVYGTQHEVNIVMHHLFE